MENNICYTETYNLDIENVTAIFKYSYHDNYLKIGCEAIFDEIETIEVSFDLGIKFSHLKCFPFKKFKKCLLTKVFHKKLNKSK